MAKRSSNGDVVKLDAVRAKRAGHGIYVDNTGSGSGAAFTVGDAFADDARRSRSIQRRIAAQQGKPAPTFESPRRKRPKKPDEPA